MTIADRVTDNWPRTEAYLLEKVPARYAAAKGNAISYAIHLLYATYAPAATVPTEETLDDGSELLKQHIADLATLQLIPMARDQYADGKLSQAANVRDGGSVSESLYDKNAILTDIEERLSRAVAGRASLIASIIQAESAPPESADVPVVCDVPGLDIARARLVVR